jgi:steroid delta-isomerase-like uncharacterized protein
MSAEENKALVRRFLETALSDNFGAIDSMIAPDFRLHFGAMPPSGAAEFKQFVPAFLSSFPDMQMQIEDLIAEGDTVAGRWRWTATHKGDFMGVPASGKRVEVIGAGFYKVRDGKIVEDRSLEDMGSLMQQIAGGG